MSELKNPWTLEEAVSLIRVIEDVCPAFGCHVALTGGCLYKEGQRKDMDILFYKIRQVSAIDNEGLLDALEKLGLSIQWETEFGTKWLAKAKYYGKSIDIFFPEVPVGEYHP